MLSLNIPLEIIEMIRKAFGDNAVSAVQGKVWHKHFKDGQESVQSDQHSGEPARSRTVRMLNVYWLQSTEIGS